MITFSLFKIIGIIGLVSICIGMIVKKRMTRDIFAIVGGVGLLIYSIYLKDLIFITLQSIYIIVVSIDEEILLKKLSLKRNSKK